jgi:hypothetical protein
MNDAADDLPVVGPSRRPGWFLGNSGTRAPHCASLNQNSPALIQASNRFGLTSQTDNQLNLLIEHNP